MTTAIASGLAGLLAGSRAWKENLTLSIYQMTLKQRPTTRLEEKLHGLERRLSLLLPFFVVLTTLSLEEKFGFQLPLGLPFLRRTFTAGK
ncbi:MAG: hypothetical protein CCU26_09770 [Nitrospira sp. UW-LDO-01]|nr:MAG: hypothetical protein CCU26_09770 [Nitrospira sp. UW-LDO-01]